MVTEVVVVTVNQWCWFLSPILLWLESPVFSILTKILNFEFFQPNTGILHLIRYTVTSSYPVSISLCWFHSYTNHLQMTPSTTSKFLLLQNLLPGTVSILFLLLNTGNYFLSVIARNIIIRNNPNFNATHVHT